MVNRIWQFHFGRGIVRSSNNFGQLGDPPTHPELLDWLAAEFVRRRLADEAAAPTDHAVERLSHVVAGHDADGLAKDPANNLFWRFDMRRLSAEEVRDSIHAVTGQLNAKMYGPSMYPEISAEVLAGQSMPGAGWGEVERKRNRRGAASTFTSSGR